MTCGAALLLVAAGCFGQRSYTAVPLQPPGFALAALAWLSDDGALGFGSAAIVDGGGAVNIQCVRYQDGAFTVLPLYGSVCSVVGANSKGQVIGALTSRSAQGMRTAPFLYQDGSLTPLPFGPADQLGTTVLQGINDRGDIVGSAYTNPQPGLDGPLFSFTPYMNQDAFLYSGGGMAQLPTLGGARTTAVAINYNGDAAGASDLSAGAGGLQTHAVLFPHAGGILDIGTLGGNYSRAVAINSKGQVAGSSTLTQGPRDLRYHAFFYDGAEMTGIRLPGVESRPESMNDAGEMVGVYRYDDGMDHPFYYANGVAVDLNTQIVNPLAGMVLITPQYINNQGQILVLGAMQPLGAGGPVMVQFLLTPAGS